jgi:pyruvate,water dikinase
MEQAGVREHLRETARDSAARLVDAPAELQALVHKAGVPADLQRAVAQAYASLGDEALVAVRSSATAEDTASASFAGMNETFTNVCGTDRVVAKIVDCWASLFGARVCSYRATRGIDTEPAIAVVVQLMVDSDRSGVMFTVDPSTGARDRIVIEGSYGLGEVVVGGQVEPDTYIVDKSSLSLLDVRIGAKAIEVTREPDGTETRRDVDGDRRSRPALAEDEVVELASLGVRIEDHYGTPQDIEWALAHDGIYIVQSRPVTTLSGQRPELVAPAGLVMLVHGLGAAPGVASGPARVLRSPSESNRFHDGEVLVAPTTQGTPSSRLTIAA